MNIGILAFRQYPYISPNTSIAYIIGEELQRRGYSITYIGRRQDASQDGVEEYRGSPIRFLNQRIPATPGRIQNKFFQFAGDRIRVSKDSKSLLQITQQADLDALICMTAPNDDALIMYFANLQIPVILCQLDPFYNLGDQENLKLKTQFLRILSKVQHLFTTDLLYRSYEADSEFKTLLSKISVLQFPKLIRREYCTPSHGSGTRLLYAGSFYHLIRSPMILVDLKNNLPENCELVFCGRCDRPQDEELLREAGVICKGHCNHGQLEREIADADFLINIGNLVKNQLASKLIDYIATGKPILNITQFDACPTVSVLRRYPLHLNVSSKTLAEKVGSTTIKNFLDEAEGKRVEWEQLAYDYCEYTPSFAANEIEKALQHRS